MREEFGWLSMNHQLYGLHELWAFKCTETSDSGPTYMYCPVEHTVDSRPHRYSITLTADSHCILYLRLQTFDQNLYTI